MWDYLERCRQRYIDLKQGADADLVQDNNKRWKRSLIMIAFGFLLMGILSYVKLPEPWDKVVIVATIILFIGGLLLERFAFLWDCFLDRPDPKGPPSMFK